MTRDGTREATQITYSRQGRVNWLPTPKRTLNPHQTFRILPQGTERPQNQAQQQGQEQARGPEQAPAILSEPFIFTEQELLDIARLNRAFLKTSEISCDIEKEQDAKVEISTPIRNQVL
ncbi:MAG: hypothetical protein GOMPHAMPRED_005442 [Gomphillus americanus]|uniref:Uncharacterized protein n=1 Tax=Gomphillus americanus TaxID=1940652 RepID=A0A8H3FR69_9LECA|nr:MAG: hypothetical protein GOMPHAMPRED_005442 [Gomphillus americanus]